MLNLQKFIIKNKDWKEKLSQKPYCLKISEKGNLILFKYNQIDSDFNEPIVNESRGIILEKNTWKVVAYAFDKFFNFGESYAAKIDWDSAVVEQKEDGSLIKVYFYLFTNLQNHIILVNTDKAHFYKEHNYYCFSLTKLVVRHNLNYLT